jgi:hypothetical protein
VLRQGPIMILCQGLAALGLATIAGCSGGPSNGACLDDSQACIESRTASYNAMVADPSKAWINEQPTREVYASGVRQFAWRSSRDRLSCEELAAGLRDMAAAKASLSQGHLPGSSAERNNQVKALTDDVAAELSGAAKKKRCKLA